MTEHPTICQLVQYRGKQGYQALRTAVVTATVDTLDPRGVDAGDVPALDSPDHVHLFVTTPSPAGFFTEYNVPLDEPGMCRPGTWQWPTRVEGRAVRKDFHAHGGWYFRRDAGGHVTIEVTESAHAGSPLKVALTVDPDTWASAVAAVSAAGETSETFYAAQALHMGEPTPVRSAG